LLTLAANATAADPALRHEPAQPKPDAAVTVSAALPAGTTSATLKLQVVEPGKYVRKTDPAYAKEWTDLQMKDDGHGSFKAVVPGSYQKHRRLVRYRVVATDAQGKSRTFPESEECPNGAWWCDAGPAPWSGSRDPKRVPPLTYPGEFQNTLQSLILLAKAEDVAKSQWDGNFHKQKQPGTIVYRGIVYDHVQFSNRGQGSAHISGKNKWALKFNPGQALPFLDHDGVPFLGGCKSLNINPGGSTPYLPVLRGVAGLDEVLSMRAYRLAGVPCAPATWIQWRVVDGPDEVNPKDQYDADLWGLYVAIGEFDPDLLAGKGLPNGLTVSIQSGIKHAPKDMPEPQKEWEKFLNGMRSNPKEEWWRKNLDLPAYYRFHALNRLLGNVDLRPDGNHGYYRHPDGRWAPIPWDNDMMFVPRHHQPGFIEAIGCLKHPAIALEFRNHAREVLDLFAADASPTGGQVGQLAADLSSALTPKNFEVDWPRLDEAMWNKHPRMNQKGSYYVNPMEGDHFGGRWKRTLETNDFAGFRKYMVDFCTDSRPEKKYAPNDGNPKGYGWGYLAFEAKDDKIPAKATVERLPGDGYRFRASEFSGKSGQAAAALEWRVGRVGAKGVYELTEHYRKDEPAGTETTIPAEVFKQPGEYRVRARWRDASGRCGHWSDAAPVTAK
jgi:hypothetical protein